MLKTPVHVEAQIRDDCMMKREDIENLLMERLQSSFPVFQNGPLEFGCNDSIHQLCEHIQVSDMDEGKVISFWQADLCVHPFRLSDQEPEVNCKSIMVTDVTVRILSCRVVKLVGRRKPEKFLERSCYIEGR